MGLLGPLCVWAPYCLGKWDCDDDNDTSCHAYAPIQCFIMYPFSYSVCPIIIIILSWSPSSLMFWLEAKEHKRFVAQSKTKKLFPSQHPPSPGTSLALDSRGTWPRCAAWRGVSESSGWASGPPAGFHGQGDTQGCTWADPVVGRETMEQTALLECWIMLEFFTSLLTLASSVKYHLQVVNLIN